MTKAQNVAIIGSGVAGLASIKCCLDAGLKPTCFEQQSWLGGLWRYSDEVRPNIASVHHSTVTNTSKAMTCFSDFPMPKEFPNYLSHRLLQKYLEMYASFFCLEQHIQFNTAVVRLARSEDHEKTGRWVVSYGKLKEGSAECDEIANETFDAVMVCNGHHWDQAKPKIPGLEKFQGVQAHSGDYRTFHHYVGKRVVVVGCANSAGDISSELSRHASQVYLSARSGCYLFERLDGSGKPTDMQLTRLGGLVPIPVKTRCISGLLNAKYNMEILGLQPTGSLWVTQFPVVNDELAPRVMIGSIIVKSDIKEVTETAVVFNGGDAVDDIDAIIFCTAFKLSFPFAKDIIRVKEDHYASLYKHIFLADSDTDTLAVIGAVDNSGSELPVFEMQARVAAEVFAGRCTLPNKDGMIAQVESRERHLKKIGVANTRLMRIQSVPYIDEMAMMIGAKPNLWSIFVQDPKLALQCFFGPCVPAQYRLQGPNSSKDAKMVIESVEENYLYPLKTRKRTMSKPKRSNYVYFFILMACLSVVWVVLQREGVW